MGIVLWIVFGALVGWIASALMGTREGLGLDIVVGIVGSVLGGWIMSFFGYDGVTGFNAYSFIVAIIGSVVLLAVVHAIRGSSTASRRSMV